MSLVSEALQRLADEVLTWIEQREAEQLAYGLFDGTMTGADIITQFRPLDGRPVSMEERQTDLPAALQYLADQVHILRLTDAPTPDAWVVRSRMAETVRLLAHLRQRIVRDDADKARHRLSSAKRLTGDVTLHVAPRRVPRRDMPIATVLDTFATTDERSQVVQLLLETITQHLGKLRWLSGFQHRAFDTLTRLIEVNTPYGNESGMVVTANTGAGKTYAFFLPILAKLILERCLRRRIGVKAICIYPRVALSENQLGDFIEAFYYLNTVLTQHNLPPLMIGIESGAAIYRLGDIKNHTAESMERRGWTFDDQQKTYLSPFAYCVGTDGKTCANQPQRLAVAKANPQALICPECGKRYNFVLFARDSMAAHPPDLLIATTESLNRRLLSSRYQYLFGTAQFAAPSVVMLDEIHLQTSTAGTQVALLLRRLLARIRMGKEERGDRANLAFVGLSATIAQPTQFLATLAGLPITRVEEVKPRDDEMQVIGAERFIFLRAADTDDTAVISTLIQATMCVTHTMPQPPAGSGIPKYRTFGFVQSLDLVGRWLYQMQDAEKVKPEQQRERKRLQGTPLWKRPIKSIPLYAFRHPPYNRQLFPQLFGAATPTQCNCEQRGPDPACPFLQAGECWWVLSQAGKALREPLTIVRKSGSDRQQVITPDDDLVITTSALEVGYDDEALMCVIQYTAPTNVASFVQRKGRGGRQVGTRPIMLTILSPYKSTDLFLFRNQHLLTDPVFRKLPLNAQNRYLQRIHGFYAFFDWLAYRAAAEGIDLDFDAFEQAGLSYLMRASANTEVILAFKAYLQRAFAMDNNALSRVLAEESDGLLRRMLEHGLIVPAHRQLTQGDRSVKPRDLLRAYLPENLFSDINLPEVQVDYTIQQEQRHGSTRVRNAADIRQSPRLRAESISLAMSETIPGNVTFRGGNGAVWVPPLPSAHVVGAMALEPTYILDESEGLVRTPRLSERALKRVGIDLVDVRRLKTYRPREIHPQRFSIQDNLASWCGDPETGQLQQITNDQQVPQHMQRLAHATSAIPIAAVDIAPEQDSPSPRYHFRGATPLLQCDPLARSLIEQAVLYNDASDNRNMLEVRRVILGSQYMLKFHDSAEEEYRGIIGFVKNETDTTPCALGYEMMTEGMSFDLQPIWEQDAWLSPTTQSRLATNAIRHSFVNELLIQHQSNYFAADLLAQILLTMTDWRCATGTVTRDELASFFADGSSESAFTKELNNTIRTIYQLSDRKAKGVQELADQDALRRRFLEMYWEVREHGPLYRQYLRDTILYSLTVAFKQVAQETAGVEALNYVASWAELQADSGERASNRIWLYEIGMGGIGVMRATHEVLRTTPEQFWADVIHKITECPTAHEESLLRLVLAQPEAWLQECERLVAQVLQATSNVQRQAQLDRLLGEVRRQLQAPIPPHQIRALLRIFVADFVQPTISTPLSNWKLYREINHLFLPRCTLRLGREPSYREACAFLYTDIVAQSSDAALYAELVRLLQAYQIEFGPDPQADDVRRAFENAVERRLLISCRGACPTCLDDRSGDIEAPGTARLLLSQTILTEWLTSVRVATTVALRPDGQFAEIAQQLGGIFGRGERAAYLRVSSKHLDSLCSAISYLTDAGIDTETGPIYPMVTDVRTLYAENAALETQIEVTVRPIL